MKLTVVGGGGFRVPMVYGALLARREELPFDDVVLHDVDADRLERIRAVVGDSSHVALAQTIADRAVVLARDNGALVPFPGGTAARV